MQNLRSRRISHSLRGASGPEEYARYTAALLGHKAIGIADRNTLAGVVRVYDALEQIEGDKPKLLVGARLLFKDGTPDILAYPTNRAAYGRLCRLISTGKHPRQERRVPFDIRRSSSMAGRIVAYRRSAR